MRTIPVATAAFLITTFAMALSPSTSDAATPSASCDAGVGTRQVVLLVHGFNSGPTTWTSDNVDARAYLAGDTTKTCTATFDYKNHSTDWVTNENIGPALAKRIVNLADASRTGKGPGKVIVVGHSMGGLATRCAVSPSCSGVNGVASDIDGVITFGTPHLGTFTKGYGRSLITDVLGPALSARCQLGDSIWRLIGCGQVEAFGTSDAARAFTPGSGELSRLPTFPSDSTFSVTALAGSVEIKTSFWGHAAINLANVGDMVVDEKSATAARRSVKGVGGSEIFDCGYLNITYLPIGPASLIQPKGALKCWHSDETHNEKFLSKAKATIEDIEAQSAEKELATVDWNKDSPQRGETSCGEIPEPMSGKPLQIYASGFKCSDARKFFENESGEPDPALGHCTGFQNGLTWCNHGDHLNQTSSGELDPGPHVRTVPPGGLSEPTT